MPNISFHSKTNDENVAGFYRNFQENVLNKLTIYFHTSKTKIGVPYKYLYAKSRFSVRNNRRQTCINEASRQAVDTCNKIMLFLHVCTHIYSQTHIHKSLSYVTQINEHIEI